MLRRTIAMTVVLSVIGSLLAFTQFYILTQGGPRLGHHHRGDGDLPAGVRAAAAGGAATAMSLVLVVITGLVTAAQFWLLRERS